MPYTCRRCHLEVPQGLDVCPNCGAAAQRPDAVIRCRHCHRRVRSNLAVCPHCGRSVQAWRPDLPFAAAAVLILVALWLGFGNGGNLLDRARTRLVALLPPPITPAPLVVLLDTPTPEDIGDIPIASLIEEPDVVEIAPLEAITDVETLVTTEPLSTTEAISVTEPVSLTNPVTTTVVTATVLAATATPTSAPTATAIPASPTPSPTSPPSRTPTATRPPATPTRGRTPSTPTATPTRIARATASPTPRPAVTPSATLRASPRPTQTPTSPPPPTATPSATLRASPTSAPAADTYIVRAGDTLLSIAQSVGRTVEALAAFNNIADPRALRVGQVLRIPPPDYAPPTAAPATPAPTSTRTPTPAPAATPTPAVAIPAPTLIEPGDNASFKGADAIIYLRWQNVGGLTEGVANMLHIGVLVGPDAIEWRYIEPQGQATDFKVPAWLFGQAPQEYGRTYVWYVQAVSGTAPVSPPSAQRRFFWD